MKARDVMTSPVITVTPSTLVETLARTLLERRISGVPVVDSNGFLVGVVSEGDLLHRAEAGTERRRSWWLRLFTGPDTLAQEYTKSRGRKVEHVMTREVITAPPSAPLRELARLLEIHCIKRVPIVENARLVGIVTRANLIQAVASSPIDLDVPVSDTKIRESLLAHVQKQPWAHAGLLNATVSDGVVDLWGFTSSDAERTALRVAAENTPGVSAVNDHLGRYPTGLGV
jgi:CBS domain-containing protein